MRTAQVVSVVYLTPFLMELFAKLFLLLVCLATLAICQEDIKCGPLPPPENVELTCTHHNETNSCKERQDTGTVARYKCSPYYIPSDLRLSSRERAGAEFQLRCRQNGSWTSLQEFEAFSCSEDCGKRLVNPKPLIVHGVASNRTVWPWHATIYKQKGSKYIYICGGTLVRHGVVMTAAHCVSTNDENPVPLNSNEFKVILGAVTYDHDENMRAEGVQGFLVRKIYISEHYNPKKDFHADIAVIHLAGTMKFNDNCLPVCLPNDPAVDLNAVKPGKSGDIVGFGLDETGKKSTVLKHASLKIMSHAECLVSLRQSLTESQFCAGNREANKFATVCNGDSGGGFVYPSPVLGKYFIHGIVSTGDSLKDNICQNYGVFTRVFQYVFWVRDVLEEIGVNVVRDLAANVKFPYIRQGVVRSDGEIERIRFDGIQRDWDSRILTIEFLFVDLDPKLLLENLEYTRTIKVLNLTNVKLDTLAIRSRVRLPFLETFVLEIVKDDMEVNADLRYPEKITKGYLKSLLFFDKDPDEHPTTWDMEQITQLNINIELTVGIFKLITIRHDEHKISLSKIPFYDEILEQLPVKEFQLKYLALSEGNNFILESLLDYRDTLEHLILNNIQFRSERLDEDEQPNLSQVLGSLKKLKELRIITGENSLNSLTTIVLNQLPLSLRQLTLAGFPGQHFVNFSAPGSTSAEGRNRSRKSKPRFYFPYLESFTCDFCELDRKTRESFHWMFKTIRKLVLKTKQPFNIKRLVDRMENLTWIYISDGSSNEKATNFYGFTHFKGYSDLPNDTSSFIIERESDNWQIRAATPNEEREEEFLEHGLGNFWTSADEYEVLSRLTPNEFKAKHTGEYKFNGSTANPDEFQPIRTIPKLLQPYLKTMEITDAQVIPEVMQFSIRHCVNLESVVMTNVKVLGLFDNRLLELPSAKHYRLSRRLFSSHLSQQPWEYIRDLDDILYRATFPFEEFIHDRDTDERIDFVDYASQPYQCSLLAIHQDYGDCVVIHLDKMAGVLISPLKFTHWMLKDLAKQYNAGNENSLKTLALRGQYLNNMSRFIPPTLEHLNLDYISFLDNDEIPRTLREVNLTALKDVRLANNYMNYYNEILNLDISSFKSVPSTIEYLELNSVNLTYSDNTFVFGNQLQLVHLESCQFSDELITLNFSRIFPTSTLVLSSKRTEENADWIENSVEWIENILLAVLSDSKTRTNWISVRQSVGPWKNKRLLKLLDTFGVDTNDTECDAFTISRKDCRWSAFAPSIESTMSDLLQSKLRSLTGKTTSALDFGKAGCEPPDKDSLQ